MANVGYATLQIIPSVRGMGDELRRQLVGPAGDAGDQAGEAAGGGFGDTFKGALAAIGVAAVAEQLGAQFTEAFTQALEQSSITKTLEGQLGSSGKAASTQGAAVGRLYAQGVTQNFEQGAEAIRSIVSGGLVSPGATLKQLDVIGAKFTDVANTFGTDMSMQSQAVAAMLKNGVAKDATAALDIITAGFQKLGPNSEDLLDTFQEYSVQLRKLGIDGSQALGLFRQGIQGGARDTDIIADAFKEFGIRAIDMSTSSQDAYKAIGLDAETMSLKIAKGGEHANSGLQLVLDRLRAIKDPVKQNAAAVGLFGTQAEDMGAALFKLDPGKATTAFSGVAGAADRLGKTLRSGPSHEIKVFTRTVKQGLVDFVGGQVLPILSSWGAAFTTVLLPPIRTVGGILGATLVPVLALVGAAFAGGVKWLRDWGAWLLPLGVAVAGLTITLNASAIATAAVTAVFSIYRGVLLAAAAVTRGYAIAQGILNAVMTANPIGLIITGIAAFVALLVVAYQRSDKFRAIVQGAWAGIQAGWSLLWNSGIKPGIDAFMVGLRAIGAAASWLWNTVLSPVFGFIAAAAKIYFTAVVVVAVLPLVAAVKLLGWIFGWLWDNAISPVVGWIGAGISLLWSGVKLYIGLWMAAFRAVGAVAMWLWKNAISPVVGWIVGGAKWLWSGVQIQFAYVKAGLRALGAAGTWLWKNALQPAFQGIASVAKWLYDRGIKPPIELAKRAARALGDAFSKAKDMVGDQFGKIADLAKKPISFIIDVVYNQGIRGVWNKVASAFGAPSLPKFKGFATGGPVFGAGTETSDDVPAWLSRNEHVWTAKEVKGAGGHGAVMSMRKWAAAGGGGSLPGFAKGGGLFGWVKGAASKGLDLAKSGVSWLKDGIKSSAMAGVNKIVRPLIEKISGSASLYRDMVTGIPERMLKAVFDFSGKADKKLGDAGIGGKGFKAALSWARTQNGLPYQWGGNGNPSWDCSGFLSAIESMIRGQKPHRRWATGAFSGSSAPPGWQLGARSPFMIGITNAGVGHTAGTINGVNVESRGGDGVVVGSRARSYRSAMFTDVYGLKGYAAGGSPRPGEIAWVGENGPELMRFSGGEVIYSNPDSMRMAAGLGPVRGFAKGTSKAARASARKQIPGDLTAFIKSLTGSAGDIAKAAKALSADLLKAGGSGKRLATATGKASAKMQDLAGKRSRLDSLLATAKQSAADQKKTAADFLGLGNLSDVTSVGGLITGMQDKQATAKAFEAQIANLSKKGLNQGLIQQLVAMGPDSALAGIVSGASANQIKQLNALASSGAKLSTSYGRTMADAMFDAGKDAGKGFLVGLQSQQTALQNEMKKLGNALVKAIRQSLDSHSPARKLIAVGQDAGAGVVIGMDSTASDVAAAAVRMADAAVPTALPAPSMAASASTSTGGVTAGQRVRLVVEGREFEAYVEELADGRADAKLTAIRRRYTSGTKG